LASSSDNYQGNDIYCDLVLSKQIEVKVVAETDSVLAFHHTNPRWSVHIVVIPKKHIESLIAFTEDDNDLLKELFDVIKTIATDITKEHGGARVLTNIGKHQNTKHLHFHISAGEELNN
jgi:histidine triad (HIT) family protein